MAFNEINTNRMSSKQFNIFVDTFENRIYKKKQNKNDINKINNDLKKLENEKNKTSSISFGVDVLYGLYLPVIDTLKTLVIAKNRYNQFTSELKRTYLSEDERKKIETQLNSAKAEIIHRTSPKYISGLNKNLSQNINPGIEQVEDILQNKLGVPINTTDININSAESIGLNAHTDTNFDNIFKEVQTAFNNVHQKVLNIYGIDEQFGNMENRNIPTNKLLDTSV
ncbi:hypothetical protein [Clostridium felsineum]|uniref:hypothetical protein n=1 Tax=Clostridium felsineum TaxID=36839 RepID=UPI00098C205C|nr:hypothetical protein [Clostridium felsineum]URZ04037.1 hypothetical protein CLAUR_041030 [Clostridium felsineum]